MKESLNCNLLLDMELSWVLGFTNKLAISIEDDFASISAFMPDPSMPVLSSPLSEDPWNHPACSVYNRTMIIVCLCRSSVLQELINKPNQITGYEVHVKIIVIYSQRLVSWPEFWVLPSTYWIEINRMPPFTNFENRKMGILCYTQFRPGPVAFILSEHSGWSSWKEKDIMILKALGMKARSVEIFSWVQECGSQA